MKSALCDRFGTEFPLFAFSHCRDVVAEVSKAGGFGVLGAVAHTAESLEIDLNWIDEHIDGKPYGVDLLIPNKMENKKGALTIEALEAAVPIEHRAHIEALFRHHGVDVEDLWSGKYGDKNYISNMQESGAIDLLDVAFRHPISMFVNALGVPPEGVIARCREQNIAVGALTGAREHAIKHAEAGVDILVVSGTGPGSA